MKLDPSRAIGAFGAVALCGACWLSISALAPSKASFNEIDVQRINVREPDGTLRIVMAGSQRIGGLVVEGKEYPHPSRTQAGLIFFNDEGTENGGLVFDGKLIDGKPTNTGHLSFAGGLC